MFEKLGIYGWEQIETVILSAIVADKAILLVGDHGTNKTEAAKIISKACLGDDATFRHYEVPHLNFDDLLGYTNPKSLTSGKLDFIATPISIWGADACLFDEINMTNPFVQGKLHELVRTRKIMGLETQLKIVFAAVNPPVKYQTAFMGIPLASRFCIVQVPALGNFDSDVRGKIIGKKGIAETGLRRIIRKAKAIYEKMEDSMLGQVVLKLAGDIGGMQINYSARQVVDLKRMFFACKALNAASDEIPYNEDVLSQIAMSTIPEVQHVVRSDVEWPRTHGVIMTTLQGFKFDNPLLSGDLAKLMKLKVQDKDLMDWLASVKTLAIAEGSAEKLESAMAELVTKKIGGKSREHVLETVSEIWAAKSMAKILVKELLV